MMFQNNKLFIIFILSNSNIFKNLNINILKGKPPFYDEKRNVDKIAL